MWKALVVVDHMSWLAGRGSGSLSVSDRQVHPERYQITPWFRGKVAVVGSKLTQRVIFRWGSPSKP
jgi:hypothetical protein